METFLTEPYTVPVSFKRSSDGKTLPIQGIAVDDTVNENSWQVPAEELPILLICVPTLEQQAGLLFHE